MMFQIVVCMIFVSGCPKDVELILIYFIPQPEKSHVEAFASFSLDSIVNDSFSSFVVCLEWSWGL